MKNRKQDQMEEVLIESNHDRFKIVDSVDKVFSSASKKQRKYIKKMSKEFITIHLNALPHTPIRKYSHKSIKEIDGLIKEILSKPNTDLSADYILDTAQQMLCYIIKYFKFRYPGVEIINDEDNNIGIVYENHTLFPLSLIRRCVKTGNSMLEYVKIIEYVFDGDAEVKTVDVYMGEEIKNIDLYLGKEEAI